MSDEMLLHIIGELPPRFYGVCPISLVSSEPCPLQPCYLARICDSYNDEYGPGCAKMSSGKICNFVHEYRTCEFEVDKSNCQRCHIANPKQIEKDQFSQDYRKAHRKKRVHKSQCDLKEWKAREVVAGLRDLHLEGRYNDS
jgi:hypothetical protein